MKNSLPAITLVAVVILPLVQLVSAACYTTTTCAKECNEYGIGTSVAAGGSDEDGLNSGRDDLGWHPGTGSNGENTEMGAGGPCSKRTGSACIKIGVNCYQGGNQ